MAADGEGDVSEPVSSCCSAPVTVAGRTTRYHVCTGCGKACDAARSDPRPAAMLQPVTFDDSPGGARPVRMVPVDEAEDDW